MQESSSQGEAGRTLAVSKKEFLQEEPFLEKSVVCTTLALGAGGTGPGTSVFPQSPPRRSQVCSRLGERRRVWTGIAHGLGTCDYVRVAQRLSQDTFLFTNSNMKTATFLVTESRNQAHTRGCPRCSFVTGLMQVDPTCACPQPLPVLLHVGAELLVGMPSVVAS